jgi:uncharacterized membrane protein
MTPPGCSAPQTFFYPGYIVAIVVVVVVIVVVVVVFTLCSYSYTALKDNEYNNSSYMTYCMSNYDNT